MLVCERYITICESPQDTMNKVHAFILVLSNGSIFDPAKLGQRYDLVSEKQIQKTTLWRRCYQSSSKYRKFGMHKCYHWAHAL